MTDKLPHNLLALFAPRPPLPYAKPLDRDPVKRKGPTITGVGQYISLLKDYDPDYVPTETVEEKKKRKVNNRISIVYLRSIVSCICFFQYY
jgi:U1 small nuclear ribonucleoprotein